MPTSCLQTGTSSTSQPFTAPLSPALRRNSRWKTRNSAIGMMVEMNRAASSTSSSIRSASTGSRTESGCFCGSVITSSGQRKSFQAAITAKTDGAGPFRVFWSIVLPMSKPVLGVVSVFAVISAWKDFLWPLLVLPDPAVQPLSVRLPAVQSQTELDVFLAALAISTLIPVLLFLMFQRLFLRSAGLGGAVKG